MSAITTDSPATASAGGGLTFAMAVACGIAVANIYYNQPMLGVIERDFPASTLPTLIPTATQLGYAAGLFLVVPLGDLLNRRRLIVTQFLILAVALAAAAIAPTAALLLGASLLVGVGATVAQQIVPFAAALASPETRGRTIGTVMAGLLCGILFSRTLAGFVATAAGWRAMFWLGMPLALVGALAMAILLPRAHRPATIGYGAALKSLAHLWVTEPTLRLATLTQAGLFASFTAFWTILVLHLQEPALHQGAAVAGLFGIVGAVGVFAAPLAGRLADRRGPQLVIGLGAVVTLASWLVFAGWNSLLGLVAGVILLDFGVQAAMVSHQHVIFALRPDARNRLNTIYMTGMFLGGSIGSAGATAAWTAGGWMAVSALGGLFALLALFLQAAFRRKPALCRA
ncbi:MAG: MFS transporter [Azospirillaceae bacterium]|nr:MFS transporter [Azospirillaceae bacterium]